ncbi:MAG: radical SAM protein [Thermoplasmata archaeon]|nr:radical SAM protein [Thermoplasmata archaeon]
MTARVAVLDGYTDEPSSLGVPPYIAPLPRYVLGAALEGGAEAHYLTIDDMRAGTDRWNRALVADILVVVAGAVVPGKYLATMPISPGELRAAACHGGTTVIGGACAAQGIMARGGGPSIDTREMRDLFDHVVHGDVDAFVHDLLSGPTDPRPRTAEEWAIWSVKGAAAVTYRDDLPGIVAELDASRGCVHYASGGCSFCMEPARGRPSFRAPADVHAEAAALFDLGVENFRLGGMPDVMSYMAHGAGEVDRPEPDPGAVGALLNAVASVGPRVFHLDNADPGMIAEHPGPARAVLAEVVRRCTSGNVLSLGLESADPAVARANNLNATAGEAMEAIRTINDVGRARGDSGLPALLPGLNFVMGLRGESKRTETDNRRFLEAVMAEGLLLRRINVRQVIWPGRGPGSSGIAHRFRAWVREEVDRPMMAQVAPAGTVLKRVRTEVAIGKVVYGRQAGSYPILVGFPYAIPTGRVLDAAVVSHGPRSVTAVEHPLDLNAAPFGALSALPGIGAKRAARLSRARPFRAIDDAASALDDPDVLARIMPLLTIGED